MLRVFTGSQHEKVLEATDGMPTHVSVVVGSARGGASKRACGMARVNVTMPDELAALVRDQLPGLNVSGVLQSALRDLVDCSHEELSCVVCGARVRRRRLIVDAVGNFYRDTIWQLHGPIARCETAEGAARVLRSHAEGWGVDVKRTPIPRATKSQRARHHAEVLAEAERDAVEAFSSGAKPRRRAAGAA